jgi:hypothetical protein
LDTHPLNDQLDAAIRAADTGYHEAVRAEASRLGLKSQG